MKISIIILFFLTTFILFGQNSDLQNYDYAKVDSFVLSFPKTRYKSHEQLAYDLTKEFSSEHEKFRAIYRWITNNISYKWKFYGTDPKKILKGKKQFVKVIRIY
jgi:hypothetical protein